MSTGMLLSEGSARMAQQVDARHVGHVPVGHHHIETVVAQHGQRVLAVVGFLDQRIAETQLDQQVANDAPHGGEIVHHEDLHILVQVFLRLLRGNRE